MKVMSKKYMGNIYNLNGKNVMSFWLTWAGLWVFHRRGITLPNKAGYYKKYRPEGAVLLRGLGTWKCQEILMFNKKKKGLHYNCLHRIDTRSACMACTCILCLEGGWGWTLKSAPVHHLLFKSTCILLSFPLWNRFKYFRRLLIWEFFPPKNRYLIYF